jgi:hypothetical protein
MEVAKGMRTVEADAGDAAGCGKPARQRASSSTRRSAANQAPHRNQRSADIDDPRIDEVGDHELRGWAM